jgi:phage shock protein A
LLAEGIRVYHLVGEDITQELTAHTIKWRKDFIKAEKMLRDGEKYGGWARGEDTARYLRQQLGEYQRLLKLLQKSNAVAARIGRKYRVNEQTLKQWIEEIEEQLEQLKNGGGGRGGGRGGPIGGGGG